MHVPPLHLSLVVQKLLSLQVLPFVVADGAHVPVDPQAWHCAHDVTLQQNPSVHIPESHCELVVHACPALSLQPPGVRQT